jgi:type VI secretion system secreted protein VgrG
MSLSQLDAPIRATTPATEELLAVTHVAWHEELGRPFEAVIDLISDAPYLALDTMVHQPISVYMDGLCDDGHWVSGLIRRFESTGSEGRLVRYRAVVVPAFYMMQYSSHCRIFQSVSAIEIIQQVFASHGYSGNLEVKTSLGTSPREYCVQYGETDFQFLQRLMDEEGIYYYFTYAESKHTMVLADSIAHHAPGSGYETVAYRSVIDSSADEYLSDYTEYWHFGTQQFILGDYDFQKPRSPLTVKQKSLIAGTDTTEWQEYPGGYTLMNNGMDFAKRRMEASDAQRHRIHMRGNVRGVRCGMLLTLRDHPLDSANIQYLVTKCALSGQSSSMQVNDASQFACYTAVELQPTSNPFRGHPAAPRPKMYGPQVATVSGKAGEDIWTDAYGRIKVQFPWDLDGKNDEQSSCWIRVSQTATGKNFGAMSLPRIGDEVIVSFLDGDPDRPIVTGRVYNAERMPPETLADAQSKTVFRTRSTKGGDATAFHELTFDDAKDKEAIFFHSERDFTREVENNDSLKVGFDKKSPGNRTVAIYNDETVQVGLGSGAGTYSLEAGKSIVLTCGESKIEMTASSIKISSPSIELNATGEFKAHGSNVTVQADAAVNVKGGATLNIESGGNLVAKGAMVQIN